MASNSLVTSLKNLRGNARGCVYTEALWGIPYNLYAPYVSIYMLALGLSDVQIGLITSIGLVFQIFTTLLSGAITDKLGRKRTTFIFDLISWSIPCLIWAVAQDFNYFLLAAVVNSIWRVTANSWQCLLVEDTDSGLLVDIWSWIYIAGLIAAFISPVTGLLIDHYSLVPTMRILYILSFVMMTAKFLVMNGMVNETKQGVTRMQETRHQPLFAVVRESPAVFKQILKSPATLYTAALMILLNICWLMKNTFWSILVTEKLGIPDEHLVIFTFARSIIMLLFFFLVMPRLRNMDVRKPLIWGCLGLVVSQIILIILPSQNYLLLMIATILEAIFTPLATALLDTLAVLTVDAKERARIMGLLAVVMLIFTSPFGWIGGQLSQMDRSLPFVLNIALFAICALLAFIATRHISHHQDIVQPVEPA